MVLITQFLYCWVYSFEVNLLSNIFQLQLSRQNKLSQSQNSMFYYQLRQMHLICQSSNNYNMKTNFKFPQTLQMLLELSVLREDNYLFSKIIIYEPDKRLRFRYTTDLKRLQQLRVKVQNQVTALIQQTDITEYWKSQLFQFSNRVYKIIKNFHQKLITFSARIAEMVETNVFLQGFRANCIEQLAVGLNIKSFVQMALDKLRKRYDKQISAFNNNFNTSKCLQLIRREENFKNNRYLMLIRDQGPQIYFKSHQQALVKIGKQIEDFISKVSKDQFSPIYLLSDLMDFEDDYPTYNTVIMHNGISLSLNYKDQGLCQFIISKWQRIFKDIKNKNTYNHRYITKFTEKYSQFLNKSKACIKSSHKRLQNSQIKQTQTIIGITSTMQMRDQSVIVQPIQELPLQPESCNEDKSKRNGLFKIQKLNNRKRSYTLRPLGEFKQNCKEVLHQKLMEIKIQDQPSHFSKVLRIRKLKAFPSSCEESGWSLLIKENTNKLAFLIH